MRRRCSYRVSAVLPLTAEAVKLHPGGCARAGGGGSRLSLGQWPGTYFDACAAVPAIVIFNQLHLL